MRDIFLAASSRLPSAVGMAGVMKVGEEGWWWVEVGGGVGGEEAGGGALCSVLRSSSSSVLMLAPVGAELIESAGSCSPLGVAKHTLEGEGLGGVRPRVVRSGRG